MKNDATLKRLFQRPPNLLLTQALGEAIAVKRMLPTESILVENLHPDLLFETADGGIVHVEMHGYAMGEFSCRNLIYFGLVLRDYARPPKQVVFWIGRGKVGVADGLRFERQLDYQYTVIDVKEIDAEPLLESGDVSESIFAILCKWQDARSTVVRILRRIAKLAGAEERKEALHSFWYYRA